MLERCARAAAGQLGDRCCPARPFPEADTSAGALVLLVFTERNQGPKSNSAPRVLSHDCFIFLAVSSLMPEQRHSCPTDAGASNVAMSRSALAKWRNSRCARRTVT